MGSNTNVRVVLIWGKNVCKTKGVCLTNNDRKQRSKVNGEGREGGGGARYGYVYGGVRVVWHRLMKTRSKGCAKRIVWNKLLIKEEKGQVGSLYGLAISEVK